ncbi:MAG: phenylacetate--CoA ligase family protein [Planctomycetota bacterium]
MNRWIARRLLYPWHEKLRGRKTYAFLDRLQSSDSLTLAELESKRDQFLRDLIQHAAAEVPYWRRVFARDGLSPDLIQCAADLERLPLMDKPVIREEADQLVADSWRERVFKLETGGSSGEPLIFFADKDRESAALAAKARCRSWFGIRMGDRQMDLWGSPIELGAHDRFRALKDRWLNFRMLSAFELSDEKMAGFRAALEAHDTDYIYGYSSVLARYARFLGDRGEDLSRLRLKAAIGTAETLFAEDRELIERIFACPVANEYGSRDGGYIAQSCPAGGLHLNLDVTTIEILDEDGAVLPAGELGEVAVTNLWSYGAPMVRYRLGDRARISKEPCGCGLPYPVLSELGGRVSDTLKTADGNRVHGLGVIYVVRVLPGVGRFQIVQESLGCVRVAVVPRGEPSRDELEVPIEIGLKQVLGQSMAIIVERVSEIPTLPSGKTRSVVCEV